VTELVAGIGHGEGLAEVGHRVARKHRDARGRGKLEGIEPELSGELLIQSDQPGRGNGGGRQARKEPLRQPRVAVVEGKSVSCFGWCEHFIPGA
jgi:hypothetical protein